MMPVRAAVPNLSGYMNQQQQWQQEVGMVLYVHPRSHTCANEALRAHQPLARTGSQWAAVWYHSLAAGWGTLC